MDLCKYKNIFGIPNEGIHAPRLFGIAITDTVATIIIAYFVSKHFNKPFLTVLLILFISGIVIHRLFCVRTTIDKTLFPNAS
jgi:hypothetical protein